MGRGDRGHDAHAVRAWLGRDEQNQPRHRRTAATTAIQSAAVATEVGSMCFSLGFFGRRSMMGAVCVIDRGLLASD